MDSDHNFRLWETSIFCQTFSLNCHSSAVVTSNHICFVIGCRYQLKAASFSDTCSNHEGRLHGERQRGQHERRRERNRHRKRRGKLIVSLWCFKKSRKTTLLFEFCLISFRREEKMERKHNSWPRYGPMFWCQIARAIFHMAFVWKPRVCVLDLSVVLGSDFLDNR